MQLMQLLGGMTHAGRLRLGVKHRKQESVLRVNLVELHRQGYGVSIPEGAQIDKASTYRGTLDDANYETGLALGVPAKLLRVPDRIAESRRRSRAYVSAKTKLYAFRLRCEQWRRG